MINLKIIINAVNVYLSMYTKIQLCLMKILSFPSWLKHVFGRSWRQYEFSRFCEMVVKIIRSKL